MEPALSVTRHNSLFFNILKTNRTLLTGLVFLCLPFFACKQPVKPLSDTDRAELYQAAVDKLTEVIIYDIFSPPVASRIYAYSNLAAYEAMRNIKPTSPSMAGRINGFSAAPAPENGKTYNASLAGIKAFLTVARSLTFSTQYFDDFEKVVFEKFKHSELSAAVYEQSLAYGTAVGNHVLAYAKTDRYTPTRGMRYTLKKFPGAWQPTPPSYADAVEPMWGTIRPLVLDSAGLFPVPPHAPYSTDKNSAYRKELTEVYDLSKNLTEEQQRIAWFWDDNALVMDVQGHTMTASKKMTPGGHWLAIGQRLSRAKKYDALQSAQVNLLISAALFDGFIACWNTKYQTHRVRPETVINADMDKNWMPYLQTPAFPEYPSGHSTISAASAEVLSSFFGDNTAFTDSTEYVFGHGVGQFSSFRAAAAEASVSRLYGGIHYRSGCDAGAGLGEKIGKKVLERLSSNTEK
jgi:hypothetical protein